MKVCKELDNIARDGATATISEGELNATFTRKSITFFLICTRGMEEFRRRCAIHGLI
jgi:hypothetical protein